MSDINREELATAKRRIHALLQKTVENGASEGEAMLAMKKAGDLMLQFNLSMNEVTLREEKCVTKHLEGEWGNRDAIWHCFDGLQRFCEVKIWIHNSGQGKAWAFFGLESDVDMALYLCRIIKSAQETSLAEYKRTPHYRAYTGHRRTASVNFIKGFGQRIYLRLCELARDKRYQEAKAHEFHKQQMADKMLTAEDTAYTSAPQGTALICVAKREKIEAEFGRVGPKLRTRSVKDTGRYDPTARDYGAAAGSKVNLGRPIEGTGSHALLK